MRLRVCLVLALVLLPILLAAQTATPSSKFVLDQVAPDLVTANSYTFKIYVDGSATGVGFPVTCTGTASPFTCAGSVPAFTPGTHSVTFTASNVAGESAKSAPFSFSMVIVPSAPANIRLQ